MMATEMVITGTQVDIIPVPMPLMITVAAPVFDAAEIACVLKGGCFITEKDIFTRVITNITEGSVFGYKYFDFGDDYTGDSITLAMKVRGMGVNCKVKILLDGEDGEEIGELDIGTSDGVYRCKVKNVTGRHALFFKAYHGIEGWMKASFDRRCLFEAESFCVLK